MADETARLALDRPLFVSSNQASSYNTAAQWRTSGSWASGSSATYSDGVLSHVTSRAWDGRAEPFTRASAVSGSLTYLLFDLANVTFDAIAIIGHDFAIHGTTGVAVQIADDNAFTTNLQTIAQWSSSPWLGTATRRLVDVTLGGGGLHSGVVVGARYTSVRWLRIQVTTTTAPGIGEVFIGQRQQLPHRPNGPQDETVLDGVDDTAETEAGVIQGVRRLGGRFNTELAWSPDSQAYEDLFRDAWAGAAYGTKPLLYLPNPSTSLRTAYLCRPDRAMAVTPIGPYEREVRLSLLEQSPFVAGET